MMNFDQCLGCVGLNISMAVIIYIVLLNSSNILSRTVLKDSEKRGRVVGLFKK